MEPRPDDSACSPATSGSAANALKHGFCASKILSPETLARADAIRAEMTEIHEPWSREESDAIAQAALCRAQLFEVERAMHLKVTAEKSRATELFDRAATDRFHADLTRFRENPAVFGPVLGLSWHGAEWLRNLWDRVRGELAPGPAGTTPCLPFSDACDAVAALGSPWQVDQADPDAARFMALWVRSAPDPDAAQTLWIERSNAPDGPSFARSRSNKYLALTPATPAQAAAELTLTATREFERWSLRANALRADFETTSDSAAEAAVGTGAGDPALEKEFRLVSRYLTSARNRADRLQRRIDILKKERMTRAYRAQRDAEREAHRLRNESEKALSRFENESARCDRERAAFHATPGHRFERSVAEVSDPGDVFVCTVDAEPTPRCESSQDPMANRPEDFAEITQAIDLHHDTTVLRNESPKASDVSGMVRERTGGTGSWVNRDSPFRDRLRMIRYRDWGNPAEIQADEADFLVQLEAIPESFERDFTIRAFFGSDKVFRRCWRAYRSWAAPTGSGVDSALG